MAGRASPVRPDSADQPAGAGSLRLQILGPLRLWHNGTEPDAGPRQQAQLLALLLARVGRPVSTRELIDLIWADDVPASALNIIHKYVGALRRVLEPALLLPMLPMSLFRRRGFAAVNAVAALFSFGMFGSIFLISQYLQNVMGYSPLDAGLRTLPWTVMPLLIAPIAGPLSDRIGGRPLMVTGLALMTGGLLWLRADLAPDTSFLTLVLAFTGGPHTDDIAVLVLRVADSWTCVVQ